MPNKSPTSLLHAVKKSYGKNRIQFKEVPETLFFTKRQMNKFSDVEADENGVVHPILGRRQCGTKSSCELLDFSRRKPCTLKLISIGQTLMAKYCG